MSSVFSQIRTNQTLAEKTYLQIRDAIVRGQLQPAQRLVYRSLAEEFGISPTPVRDAIQRLASEGALDLDDRGVATVPVLSVEQYVEIIALRIELEGRAAAAAASRHPGLGFIDTLTRLHQDLEKSIAVDDDATLIANERFHFSIIEAAQQPVLASLIGLLWLKCGPSVRYLYRGTYARAAEHPHIRLIHALEQRDGPAARQAVVQDLQSACLHILRKIAKDDGMEFPQEWVVAGGRG